MANLAPLWQRLMRSLFLHPSNQAFNPNIPRPVTSGIPILTEREKKALKFVMDGEYRNEFLLIQAAVEEWQHRPLTQSRLFREPYLRTAVPEEHWNATTYPEYSLVMDVERLLKLSEYLLGFAHFLGPRMDLHTQTVRRRMHRLYLNAGLSIVLWAPHWQRPFPDGWRHIHADPHTEVPLQLLQLNPQNNHRYRTYLKWLNDRALFHHPDPDAWAMERAWHLDIGHVLRS